MVTQPFHYAQKLELYSDPHTLLLMPFSHRWRSHSLAGVIHAHTAGSRQPLFFSKTHVCAWHKSSCSPVSSHAHRSGGVNCRGCGNALATAIPHKFAFGYRADHQEPQTSARRGWVTRLQWHTFHTAGSRQPLFFSEIRVCAWQKSSCSPASGHAHRSGGCQPAVVVVTRLQWRYRTSSHSAIVRTTRSRKRQPAVGG